MARVWVYDRIQSKKYRDAVAKAKAAKRKPPNRYLVMYYDKTGKQRSESVPTRARADLRVAELSSALLTGTYTDPVVAKVKFAEVAEKWLESRTRIKPSTWWKYRGLLDNHVLPEWGNVALNAIEREDVALWVARLLKPTEEDGSNLSPSTARLAFRVLSMVLEWCVPRRLAVNPARGVELPVVPEAEHVYLTYEQVEALAAAAGELRTKYKRPTAAAAVNRALILFLAYTGVRWGEAAALRVRNVDLDNRRVRIVATLYEIKGGQVEGLPKSGKPRTVPLPASLVDELRPLIAGRGPEDRVFTTSRGKPLRKANWRRREFLPALRKAGLDVDRFTPHKLRHTAASLAIAAGADVKVVQSMLGHADASITLNVYGHLFPDRLDEVASTLDARRRAVLEARQNGPEAA
jgi:integrase